MPESIVMCWSGGKDSALALGALSRQTDYNVVALLTTVTAGYDRISMHGVRRSLLLQQTESLGLPLREVEIPTKASNNRSSYATASARHESDLILDHAAILPP